VATLGRLLSLATHPPWPYSSGRREYRWPWLTYGDVALPRSPWGESPVSNRAQLTSIQMEEQHGGHSPQRVGAVAVFCLFGAPRQDLMHDGVA
jgi:hypothetical protein